MFYLSILLYFWSNEYSLGEHKTFLSKRNLKGLKLLKLGVFATMHEHTMLFCGISTMGTFTFPGVDVYIFLNSIIIIIIIYFCYNHLLFY